jgi:nucleotide-binding universal stress UspA family protein
MSAPMKKKSASARKRRVPEPTARIKEILVPIDFSRASREALRWAKFFARRCNARIHLLHVHHLEYPLAGPIAPPPVISEQEIEERLYAELIDFALEEKISKAGDCHIRIGRTFHEICQLAVELKADLIVLSTHGRTGWKRAVLGSTAERTIRHTPCPVFVTRPLNRKRRKEPVLGNMMVPVDFSDCSTEGLRYAVKLARAFGAKLELFHVLHFEHYDMPVVVYDEKQLDHYINKSARAHMDALVRDNDLRGVSYETAIGHGVPARQISRRAANVPVDLIVIATHGRTGLPHMLIGSTAEQIVRYAKMPVLVVPTRRHDEFETLRE